LRDTPEPAELLVELPHPLEHQFARRPQRARGVARDLSLPLRRTREPQEGPDLRRFLLELLDGGVRAELRQGLRDAMRTALRGGEWRFAGEDPGHLLEGGRHGRQMRDHAALGRDRGPGRVRREGLDDVRHETSRQALERERLPERPRHRLAGDRVGDVVVGTGAGPAEVVRARLAVLRALLPFLEPRARDASRRVRGGLSGLTHGAGAVVGRDAAAGDRHVQAGAGAAGVVRAREPVVGTHLAFGDRRGDAAALVGTGRPGGTHAEHAVALVAERVHGGVIADARQAVVRRARAAVVLAGRLRRRDAVVRGLVARVHALGPGRTRVAGVGTHAAAADVGTVAEHAVLARRGVRRVPTPAQAVAEVVGADVAVIGAGNRAGREAVVGGLVAARGALRAGGAWVTAADAEAHPIAAVGGGTELTIAAGEARRLERVLADLVDADVPGARIVGGIGAAPALVRRLRLTGVGSFVADTPRARAVQRRAVAGRRPRAHAVVARVADGAELAVVARAALMGGLRLTGVGRFITDTDGTRAVECRAVAACRPGAHAVVAHVADGTELAVVAGAALIGGLRLTRVGRLVADARGARTVQRRAVTSCRPGAHAVVALVTDGAEIAVVAAVALVCGLGLTRVGVLVTDAGGARTVQRRAITGRRPSAGTVAAYVADGAEIAVVAHAALVGRLGLTRVGLLVTDADRACPIQCRAVTGRPATCPIVAGVADGAEVAVATAVTLVGRLRLAGVGGLVADARHARSIQVRAVARRPAARSVVARVVDGAEVAVAAAVALIGRFWFALAGSLVANPPGAGAVQLGAVARRPPGARSATAGLTGGAEGAVVTGLPLGRRTLLAQKENSAGLHSIAEDAVVAIPVPAAYYLCLSGGREPEEETDGEEQLRPCHPSPGLHANAFLFHPRPRALRCARRHSGPRIAPERCLE